MIVESQVVIRGPREAVWSVVSNIENASETISGIDKVEVLEKPVHGLVGLKWRETRTMFGKSATEVMWITDAAENDYFKSRAESCGCVYQSTMRLAEQGEHTSLTMTHDSQPQGIMVKLLALPMGILFKGAMKKAIHQDLEDIKAAVETSTANQEQPVPGPTS